MDPIDAFGQASCTHDENVWVWAVFNNMNMMFYLHDYAGSSEKAEVVQFGSIQFNFIKNLINRF